MEGGGGVQQNLELSSKNWEWENVKNEGTDKNFSKNTVFRTFLELFEIGGSVLG